MTQLTQTRQEQAFMTVQMQPAIQYMTRVEPLMLLLLQKAALPYAQGNRWHIYEDLKLAATMIVGDDARQPALRTHRHYETLICAIDTLLAAGEEDNEEPFI